MRIAILSDAFDTEAVDRQQTELETPSHDLNPFTSNSKRRDKENIGQLIETTSILIMS